ncbi:MAG: VRR-NUC domain-containing protein [Alphaproteobacteria bacterium]|nr:MAG: VRR-NUC domain-containing protein [Alphaproteobacteria bacterium]
MVDGARRRALGVAAGWPDLVVVVPGRPPWFFEVKTRRGRLSPAQAEMHERLRALGCRVATVRSADEAIEVVREWRRLDRV